MTVKMMNWIKSLRHVCKNPFNDTPSFSTLPVEAIILESMLTGNRNHDLVEIKLLLQVFPGTGRNFILSHYAFFTEDELSEHLQTGQKIRLYPSPLQKNKFQLVLRGR